MMHFKIDGKVAIAMSPAFSQAVIDGLERAKSEAQAVLMVGRPGRFSAGFDLKVIAPGGEARTHMVKLGVKMLYNLFTHPQPVVMAFTGHALVGGAFMLLTGDTRIGTKGDFKIGLNEVAIGMSLPDWGIALAQNRLSRRHITAATIQAQIYDPAGAVDAGYLDEVCEAEALLEMALTRANALAELPQANYAKMKTLMRQDAIEQIRQSMA
ncbi:enoyl-CoA hydratase [Candidatus Entotheonella serta]|nr:enoyl-CoA hydratase [Candidatus Entotheonella serta]